MRDRVRTFCLFMAASKEPARGACPAGSQPRASHCSARPPPPPSCKRRRQRGGGGRGGWRGGAGAGAKADRHRRLLERRGQASGSPDTLRQTRPKQRAPLRRAMHSGPAGRRAALRTPPPAPAGKAGAGAGARPAGPPSPLTPPRPPSRGVWESLRSGGVSGVPSKRRGGERAGAAGEAAWCPRVREPGAHQGAQGRGRVPAGRRPVHEVCFAQPLRRRGGSRGPRGAAGRARAHQPRRGRGPPASGRPGRRPPRWSAQGAACVRAGGSPSVCACVCACVYVCVCARVAARLRREGRGGRGPGYAAARPSSLPPFHPPAASRARHLLPGPQPTGEAAAAATAADRGRPKAHAEGAREGRPMLPGRGGGGRRTGCSPSGGGGGATSRFRPGGWEN